MSISMVLSDTISFFSECLNLGARKNFVLKFKKIGLRFLTCTFILYKREPSQTNIKRKNFVIKAQK